MKSKKLKIALILNIILFALATFLFMKELGAKDIVLWKIVGSVVSVLVFGGLVVLIVGKMDETK